jgi:putative membrane protein
MNWITKLVLRVAAVGIAAYIVPGVTITGIEAAVVAAIVLGILNSILKPILIILTLPVTIMTLGLFTVVINTAMVLLAASIVPGFAVNGFWTALIFSIVLALVNGFLNKLGRG